MCAALKIKRYLAGAIVVCASLLWVGPAFAQQGRILVEIGKATILPQIGNVETVFIADNSIADANVSPGNEVFVFGKSVGETTLIATSADQTREFRYTVIVTYNLSEIRRSLSQRFPGSAVSISSSRGSILISGAVESEATRQRIIETIEAGVPNAAILDQLSVTSSNLIRLRVRLLEVNRTRAENFGIDWNATVASNGFFIGTNNRGVLTFGEDANAEGSLNASIDVLATNGIVSVAQETLISTVNGQDAEFAVGGEIPIPTFISEEDVPGGGNYSLDFKFVGTQLTFTPSSAPGNKLRLAIDSTISTADTTTATVNGNVFPNLSTRSFKTNVELKDRQSFAIAGISRNETVAALRNARNSGFSRVIDSLFGTDRTSGSAQELVVIVTPILSEIDPIDITKRLPERPTNLQYILMGGSTRGGKSSSSLNVKTGSAGFQY